MKTDKKVIGYKGFDKEWMCSGKKYAIGKTFIHKGKVELCRSGFHFCENPLDVLSYYKLNDSNFALIEALGVSDEKDRDSKRVARKITIKAQLELPAFIKAAIDFVWNECKKDATSGNYAHSATSGDYAHSATSGNRANSATSGYGAHSATETNDAIACAVGRRSKAKASKGSWIVLSEWYEGGTWEDAKPINVKSAQVDGKKVKADQWYKLVDGEFVETDDSNE